MKIYIYVKNTIQSTLLLTTYRVMIFFNIHMTFYNKIYIYHLACYNRKDMSSENAVNCATIIIFMNRGIAKRLFRTENTCMCIIITFMHTHKYTSCYAMHYMFLLLLSLIHWIYVLGLAQNVYITLTSKDFQALFMVKKDAADFLNYNMHQLKYF